jgi:hypothetical protein
MFVSKAVLDSMVLSKVAFTFRDCHFLLGDQLHMYKTVCSMIYILMPSYKYFIFVPI